MSHTPGPWKWSDRSAFDDTYPSSDMLQNQSGGYVLIGEWHNDSTAGISIQSADDARLIAAAPGLLAMLREAIVALVDCDNADYYAVLIEDAKAAIKKAEGR